MHLRVSCINTLRPRQNGRHFADDSFNCIFLNENCWVFIQVSPNFVRNDPFHIFQHWSGLWRVACSAIIWTNDWIVCGNRRRSLRWRHIGAMASQITSLTIVYSIVYSGADQRKHQSSASPVNYPHKWPVTRWMFPFDDVIMWVSNKSGGLNNTFTNYVVCCAIFPLK